MDNKILNMKKIYFIFLILILGCTDNNKIGVIGNVIDTNYIKEDSCVLFDDSIKEIGRLLSPINHPAIRNNIKYLINHSDTSASDLYILNKTNKLYLRLIIIPGFGKYEFGCFEIGEVDEAFDKKYININQNDFISNFGFRINMDYSEVLSLLKTYNQNDFIRLKNNNKILIVCENNNLSFMRKYNMPIYKSEFIFKNNKLKLYKFGFENP